MKTTLKKVICCICALTIMMPAFSNLLALNTVQATNPDETTESTHGLISDEEAAVRQEQLDSFANAALFSENNYSEVLYISTVEDLLSIDGHDGGYYELECDINLAGREWTPIRLTNATFNGNGHKISGMKITKKSGSSTTGFMVGQGNYMSDLTLNNFDINITDSFSNNNYVVPAGDVYAYNCVFRGDVSVTNTALEQSLSVCGIYDGNSNVYYGNMTLNATAANSYRGPSGLYGLDSCSNSTFNGNITVEGLLAEASAIHICEYEGSVKNCRFNGNVYVGTDATGQAFCVDSYGTIRDCSFHGNVIGDESSFSTNYEVAGFEVRGGNDALITNCVLYGNIINGDVGFFARHNGRIDRCVMEGDIKGSSYCTSGMTADFSGIVSSCVLKGDVSGDSTFIIGMNVSYPKLQTPVTGKVTNCSIYGDIYHDPNVAVGIYGVFSNGNKVNNCSIYGDVKTSTTIYGNDCFGIYGGYNNRLNGNVYIEGGGCGIYEADGKGSANTINGRVYKKARYGTIVADKKTPLVKEFYCLSCDTVFTETERTYYISTPCCGLSHTKFLPNSPHCIQNCNKCEKWWKENYDYEDRDRPDDYHGNFCRDCDCETCYYCNPALSVTDPNEDDTVAYRIGKSSISAPGYVPPVSTEETEQSFAIKVIDSISGKPVAGALISADGKEYATNSNGIAFLKQDSYIESLNVSNGGQMVYSAMDYIAIPGDINEIKINGLKLTKEDIGLSFDESTTVTGPEVKVAGENVPIFELPFDFEFNFDEVVSVAYDETDNTYKVTIGKAKAPGEAELTPEWREQYDKIEGLINGIRKGGIKGDDIFVEMNSKKPKIGKLGIDASYAMEGFIEITPGDTLEAKGGVVVAVKLESEVSAPIAACPIVYFTYGFDGEVGAGLNLILESAKYYDPKFKIEGEINLDFGIHGGIGAGFKKLLSVEAGIEGGIENTLKLPPGELKESLESKLSADVYFLRNILGYEDKVSKKFLNYKLFPWESDNSGKALSLYGMQNDDILMDLDDLSNMKITPRDYLENGISLYSTNLNSDYDTLKTNVYPYTDVQTVTLADGRKLTVWLDDDTDRDIYNKTALYYRIHNNGVWSEPQQIDDDGTSDFDFSLAVCGNKAAILYQNMTEAITDSDNAESVPLKSDLSYVEFDGTAWTEPINITTENSDYEYSPELYLGEDASHIMWVQNNKNTPSPATDTTAEAVYTTSITEGTMGDIIKEADNLGLIIETEITASDRIYVSDSDGDISTDGSSIYINGEKIYETENNISDLLYLNDNLYFNENGSVYCTMKGLGYAWTEVNGNYKDARIINDSMIIFEKENGFNSELWAASREYNEFKDPVPLVQIDKRIRSWDVTVGSNGEIELAVAAAEVAQASESVSQNVEIIYVSRSTSDLDVAPDIEVVGMETENVQRGKTATFNIYALNNSTDVISEYVNVTIKAGETELYNNSEYLGAAEDETGKISVQVPIPEDFSKQEITATVMYEDEYKKESNLENNTVSRNIGYADLSCELYAQTVSDDGEVKVNIENIGCEDAENVTLTLKTNSGEQIYTENTGTVKIGENRTITVPVPEKYYTFSNQYDKTVFVAEVASDADETASSNNISSYTLENIEKRMISLSEESIDLMPEQKFTPDITISPMEDNLEVYYFSSDETVATVDENGTVTAKAIGTATITYTTNDALLPGILAVNVCEKVITPAKFFSYYEDSEGIVITGFLEDEFTGTDVIIPDTIEEINVVGIDNYAFSGCSKIKSITIGANVSFINEGAFSDMSACNEILVNENNQYFSSVGGNLYDIDQTVFISYATGKTDKSFAFPEGVETIEMAAIQGSPLETITLPASLTEIYMGGLVGASSLTEVSVAEGNLNFSATDGILFNKDKTTLYLYPSAKQASKYTVPDEVTVIDTQAFYHCTKLKEVILSDNITDIGEFAFFNCNSLKKVKLPANISQIKQSVFGYCKALENIIIPTSVTKIDDYAFNYCTSLKYVLYSGTQSQWEDITIGNSNDALLNSKLCFEFTVTAVTEDGKTFSVKPINITKGYTIILALYDEGKLVEMQTKVYGDEDVLFTTDKEYTDAKIMVLEKIDDLKPACISELLIR